MFDDIKITIKATGKGFVHWTGDYDEKYAIFSKDFEELMTFFSDDFTKEEVTNAINF